jgi:polyisoprenoid-binding protein YceI
MKILTSTLFAALLFTSQAFAGEASLNAKKSKLEWIGKKALISDKHNGTINIKSGGIVFKKGEPVSGNVVVDMTTIKNLDLTNEKYNKKLVGHLKSDDFFSVDKFKEAKINIKSFKKKGKSIVGSGDLTIKGKTHPATFTAEKIMKNGKVTGLKAKLTFDRSLYDVRYGSGKFFDNLGDKMIADEIDVTTTLVFKKPVSK